MQRAPDAVPHVLAHDGEPGPLDHLLDRVADVAELNPSPNTISRNLSKIYRKLGVSSRTELAERVTETLRE